MNPNNEIERGRLFKATEWSYRQLEPFRNLVHGLVAEYAGSAYGQKASGRPKYEILCNLTNQTVDAYTMSLVANRPRVSITARRNEVRVFAKKFEVAINNLIAEIQLEYTLRQAVMDAFFCMGIVKMHLKESPQVRLEGDIVINPTMPFASNVSIDNWVHDMTATSVGRFQYAGDWYRIPFEDLKLDVFDQALVKQLELKPTSKWSLGDKDDRLDRIAAGDVTDNDELVPMIDVFDVWVPRDKKIYTFPIDPRRPFSGNTRAIAVLDWTNPQYGPYPILSFNDVPENVVPSSPASHLAGMARIINNIARKQSRKAHGQRDIFTYTPAALSDAQKVMGASDQQAVAVQDQSEIQVLKLGGVDQPLHAYMLAMIALYDRMAGNLGAMAGLGASAPTLGQEEMIHGAVSKKEAAMQYRVVDFATNIVRQLGYMLWNDKSNVIPGSYTHPGMEDSAPSDVTWTPFDREGDFPDYDLNIDVYSMPHKSPAEKLQTVLALVQNVFLPGAPMMAQQGGQINYKKIAEIASRLLDEPELTELVTFNSPPPDQGGGGGGAPSGMATNTTREYVRRSVSGPETPEAAAMAGQEAWLAQPEQQAVTAGE